LAVFKTLAFQFQKPTNLVGVAVGQSKKGERTNQNAESKGNIVVVG